MPWLTQVEIYDRYRGHGYAVKGQVYLPSDEKKVIGRVYQHKYDARIWAEDSYENKDMSNFIWEVKEDEVENMKEASELATERVKETIDGIYRDRPKA